MASFAPPRRSGDATPRTPREQIQSSRAATASADSARRARSSSARRSRTPSGVPAASSPWHASPLSSPSSSGGGGASALSASPSHLWLADLFRALQGQLLRAHEPGADIADADSQCVNVARLRKLSTRWDECVEQMAADRVVSLPERGADAPPSLASLRALLQWVKEQPLSLCLDLLADAALQQQGVLEAACIARGASAAPPAFQAPAGHRHSWMLLSALLESLPRSSRSLALVGAAPRVRLDVLLLGLREWLGLDPRAPPLRLLDLAEARGELGLDELYVWWSLWGSFEYRARCALRGSGSSAGTSAGGSGVFLYLYHFQHRLLQELGVGALATGPATASLSSHAAAVAQQPLSPHSPASTGGWGASSPLSSPGSFSPGSTLASLSAALLAPPVAPVSSASAAGPLACVSILQFMRVFAHFHPNNFIFQRAAEAAFKRRLTAHAAPHTAAATSAAPAQGPPAQPLRGLPWSEVISLLLSKLMPDVYRRAMHYRAPALGGPGAGDASLARAAATVARASSFAPPTAASQGGGLMGGTPFESLDWARRFEDDEAAYARALALGAAQQHAKLLAPFINGPATPAAAPESLQDGVGSEQASAPAPIATGEDGLQFDDADRGEVSFGALLRDLVAREPAPAGPLPPSRMLRVMHTLRFVPAFVLSDPATPGSATPAASSGTAVTAATADPLPTGLAQSLHDFVGVFLAALARRERERRQRREAQAAVIVANALAAQVAAAAASKAAAEAAAASSAACSGASTARGGRSRERQSVVGQATASSAAKTSPTRKRSLSSKRAGAGPGLAAGAGAAGVPGAPKQRTWDSSGRVVEPTPRERAASELSSLQAQSQRLKAEVERHRAASTAALAAATVAPVPSASPRSAEAAASPAASIGAEQGAAAADASASDVASASAPSASADDGPADPDGAAAGISAAEQPTSESAAATLDGAPASSAAVGPSASSQQLQQQDPDSVPKRSSLSPTFASLSLTLPAQSQSQSQSQFHSQSAGALATTPLRSGGGSGSVSGSGTARTRTSAAAAGQPPAVAAAVAAAAARSRSARRNRSSSSSKKPGSRRPSVGAHSRAIADDGGDVGVVNPLAVALSPRARAEQLLAHSTAFAAGPLSPAQKRLAAAAQGTPAQGGAESGAPSFSSPGSHTRARSASRAAAATAALGTCASPNGVSFSSATSISARERAELDALAEAAAASQALASRAEAARARGHWSAREGSRLLEPGRLASAPLDPFARGPGSYNPPSDTFLARGGGARIRGKSLERTEAAAADRARIPGPAHYRVPSSSLSPRGALPLGGGGRGADFCAPLPIPGPVPGPVVPGSALPASASALPSPRSGRAGSLGGGGSTPRAIPGRKSYTHATAAEIPLDGVGAGAGDGNGTGSTPTQRERGDSQSLDGEAAGPPQTQLESEPEPQPESLPAPHEEAWEPEVEPEAQQPEAQEQEPEPQPDVQSQQAAELAIEPVPKPENDLREERTEW